MGKNDRLPPELLSGTVDLLILKSLAGGSRHGYAIAQHIRASSDEVLELGESSLYTALQRLLLNGWVKDEWGASENNRRAKYYELSKNGRQQLEVEKDAWEKLTAAVAQVLGTV